ncbi:MAG: DMT family transporter [Candidatus Eisenbacteria bacterium]
MTRARSAALATIGAGLLWGSSFSVIKIGLRSIDPYWFVFLRFSIASVLALAFLSATGRQRAVVALLRHPLVLWLGATNAVGFIFQFKGQTLTTAGNAALIINSCTIYVAIASRFVFRERLGPLKLLGVVAGMVGVYLVATGGRLAVTIGDALAGDLLVFVAALTWTAFILLDKKIVGLLDVDVRALTGAMVVVTAVASLPVALVFGRGSFPTPGPEWWTVPYTSVFCTIIPFFLWTWGLKSISATSSSVIMLSEVVFALALASVILGERLTPGGFVGSALIVLAILLASRESAVETAAGPDVVPE